MAPHYGTTLLYEQNEYCGHYQFILQGNSGIFQPVSHSHYLGHSVCGCCHLLVEIQKMTNTAKKQKKRE